MPTKREEFDSKRKVRLLITAVDDNGTRLPPGEYDLDQIPDAAIAADYVVQPSKPPGEQSATIADGSDEPLVTDEQAQSSSTSKSKK